MRIAWFSLQILFPRRLRRGVERDSSCLRERVEFRASCTAVVALVAIPLARCGFHFVLPSLFVVIGERRASRKVQASRRGGKDIGEGLHPHLYAITAARRALTGLRNRFILRLGDGPP